MTSIPAIYLAVLTGDSNMRIIIASIPCSLPILSILLASALMQLVLRIPKALNVSIGICARLGCFNVVRLNGIPYISHIATGDIDLGKFIVGRGS